MLGWVRAKICLDVYVPVQEPYHITLGIVSKQIVVPRPDKFPRSRVQGQTKKPICNSFVYSFIQLPVWESEPVSVLLEVVGSMQSTLESARILRPK